MLAKFGRKTIIQFGTFATMICLVIISVGFFLNDSENTEDAANALIITGLVIYMAIFGISLGPLPWLYVPEIAEP